MQGEADPKQLEFYVTVEYYKNKKHATDNVEVNNPFPQNLKPKTSSSPAKAKGSPAEQNRNQKKRKKELWKALQTNFWNSGIGVKAKAERKSKR